MIVQFLEIAIHSNQQAHVQRPRSAGFGTLLGPETTRGVVSGSALCQALVLDQTGFACGGVEVVRWWWVFLVGV